MVHPSAGRIRRAREALPGDGGRHLSRQELAHRIGVSLTTLYRWEREGIHRRRDADKLVRLAQELGKPLDWLLGGGPDEPPPR